MSVSAVTLDAHGVLLLPDPAALRCALAPFDVHPDDDTCWRVHFEMVNLIDQYVEPNWHEVRRSMAAAFGLSAQQVDGAAPIVAAAYLNEPWIAAPGAMDSIVRLVSSDHSLAVVANSTHGQVEQWLADAGLCSIVGPLPKVACVLDSHVVGFAKPDRRIFDMALIKLGISADECLHVGDSVQTDVVGARAAGITPVHVDPYGFCESGHHDHSMSLEGVVNELLG